MASNRICHFKLVLLGDSAVGKSCLVVRFVRNEFFEFQEPTIGGTLSFLLKRNYVRVLQGSSSSENARLLAMKVHCSTK